MIKIMTVEERSKYTACQVCLGPHPKYFVPVKTAQGVVTAALCNKRALIYAYEEKED